MFQLTLNFLSRQAERFNPAQSRSLREKSPFVWKHGITVHLMRRLRARRYLLRLQTDGSARLTIPRGGSQAEALRFLERSETWLKEQHGRWQGRVSARLPWHEGTSFLFRGEPTVLRVEGHGRGVILRFAEERLTWPREQADYRETVLAHLRRLADRELPPRTRELAQKHGISISRVTVRGQKTRWGSCSARGTISLNWRLMHAPPHVVDYLIIHELMHRREMNHSGRYWKLVAEACPEYEVAEKWLKGLRIETLS